MNVLLVYPERVSWIYMGSLALLAVCLGPEISVFSPSSCGSLILCSQAPRRRGSLRECSFANIFFLFFLVLVVSLTLLTPQPYFKRDVYYILGSLFRCSAPEKFFSAKYSQSYDQKWKYLILSFTHFHQEFVLISLQKFLF